MAEPLHHTCADDALEARPGTAHLLTRHLRPVLRKVPQAVRNGLQQVQEAPRRPNWARAVLASVARRAMALEPFCAEGWDHGAACKEKGLG